MPSRRTLAGIAIAVLVAFIGLALPRATVACSCAMPGPMADVRGDPEIAVFTGVVDPRDPAGYPVTVTRWFQGGFLEPRVWFTAGSFSGDGASCGVAPLRVATEWIFVAYRVEGQYGTRLCSPHALLAGADGQAMLADAIATFGGGQPGTTDPPAATSPAPIPADPGSVVTSVGAFVLVLMFGVAVLFGIVGALRRTRVGRD